MERKLTTSLAADIANYSRLMHEDEEAAHDALRSHSEVAERLVAVHRGRVFGGAGDSIIAEFPSAVEAINCAVQIQQEMVERNAPVPKNRRLEFRIGLNIGDVITEDGNLFGDGVNVASRVQQLAAPGGICVTRNVYNQVKNKVPIAFRSLGEHNVKNIAEPVSVYQAIVEGINATRQPAAWLNVFRRRKLMALSTVLIFLVLVASAVAWNFHPPARAPVSMPSVAVLPFDNLSGNPNLGYFSDGVSEDI